MDKIPLIQQYLQLRSEFMGYLYAMTRDAELAEEVYQNAAVVVMEKAEEREAIRNSWESTRNFFQRNVDKLQELNDHPDPAAKGWFFVIMVLLMIGFLGFFACLGAGCYHCCSRQCCPYRGTNRVNIYDQSRYQEFVRIAFRIWLQENQDRVDLKARLEREAKVRKDRLDLERQEETTVCTTACESTTIGLDG